LNCALCTNNNSNLTEGLPKEYSKALVIPSLSSDILSAHSISVTGNLESTSCPSILSIFSCKKKWNKRILGLKKFKKSWTWACPKKISTPQWVGCFLELTCLSKLA
jgi:hypothetical protein